MNFKIGQIYTKRVSSTALYTYLITKTTHFDITIQYIRGRVFGDILVPGYTCTLLLGTILTTKMCLDYETDATSYEDLQEHYPELLI